LKSEPHAILNEGEDDMIRKKYNNEQIIVVLKEAEASTNSLTQINFRDGY